MKSCIWLWSVMVFSIIIGSPSALMANNLDLSSHINYNSKRIKNKWTFGISPEFWYIKCRMNFKEVDDNIYKAGSMWGISAYASKEYTDSIITVYGVFRKGQFGYDWHKTDSDGTREHEVDLRRYETELKARWVSKENATKSPCFYLVGGVNYVRMIEEYTLETQGWIYTYSGKNRLDIRNTYWSPFIGFGVLSLLSDNWVHKAELTVNMSYVTEKIEDALPEIDDRDDEYGLGCGLIYTLLYRINENCNIQGGFKYNTLNSIPLSNDIDKDTIYGIYLMLGVNL